MSKRDGRQVLLDGDNDEAGRMELPESKCQSMSLHDRFSSIPSPKRENIKTSFSITMKDAAKEERMQRTHDQSKSKRQAEVASRRGHREAPSAHQPSSARSKPVVARAGARPGANHHVVKRAGVETATHAAITTRGGVRVNVNQRAPATEHMQRLVPQQQQHNPHQQHGMMGGGAMQGRFGAGMQRPQQQQQPVPSIFAFNQQGQMGRMGGHMAGRMGGPMGGQMAQMGQFMAMKAMNPAFRMTPGHMGMHLTAPVRGGFRGGMADARGGRGGAVRGGMARGGARGGMERGGARGGVARGGGARGGGGGRDSGKGATPSQKSLDDEMDDYMKHRSAEAEGVDGGMKAEEDEEVVADADDDGIDDLLA